MARKLRVEYPGAIYHVMNRGDRREPIFLDDHDRRTFVDTLGATCAKTGWQVHAWCLMPNHFHLVVETPGGNLVAGMKWLLGTYTGRFNRRHKLFGHLFSGRYKALIVDGSGNGYLRTVCDYVHLNPVRARLLKPGQRLAGYAWSSFPGYLQPAHRRPGWLRCDRWLGERGIPRDSAAGRKELARQMVERCCQEDGDQFKALRRGWFLGDEQFKAELLEQAGQRLGAEHYGEERRETQAERAEEIVRAELARRKWTDQTLAQRPKGDREKIRIAARLRRDTVMPVHWIAARLQMGSVSYLNNRLYLWRTKTGKSV